MIIDIKKSAYKTLKKLPPKIAEPVEIVINELKIAATFHEFKKAEKLTGHSDRYKIRIGNYRIVIKKESDTHITITAIANRKDIYNKLFDFII